MPGSTSRTSLMHKGFRILAVLLVFWLVPSTTCAAAHIPVDRFARTVAVWGATSEKSASDAIRLVQSGDGALALARLETHGHGVLLPLRQFTAYLFLELANSAGALPQAMLTSSRPSDND